MTIDLNADLGEGAGFDAELMPLITSANVCCGRHAGSASDIAATLALARHHGVAVGAHPGYDDRAHFGRRELHLSEQELAALIAAQLAALDELARACGVALRYVKPHGALYNQAAREVSIARVIAETAANWRLPVVGLPGSVLARECERRSGFIPEGFADRRYRPDGSLVPRTEPDALIHDPEAAVAQVAELIRATGIRTICVHGDNPQAVAFARAVRESLLARGFQLKPFA